MTIINKKPAIPARPLEVRWLSASRLSGIISLMTRNTIAPAANPNAYGRMGRKAITARYAGTAAINWGTPEKIAHPTHFHAPTPSARSGKATARPSGILWIAIAIAIMIPRLASPEP